MTSEGALKEICSRALCGVCSSYSVLPESYIALDVRSDKPRIDEVQATRAPGVESICKGLRGDEPVRIMTFRPQLRDIIKQVCVPIALGKQIDALLDRDSTLSL